MPRSTRKQDAAKAASAEIQRELRKSHRLAKANINRDQDDESEMSSDDDVLDLGTDDLMKQAAQFDDGHSTSIHKTQDFLTDEDENIRLISRFTPIGANQPSTSGIKRFNPDEDDISPSKRVKDGSKTPNQPVETTVVGVSPGIAGPLENTSESETIADPAIEDDHTDSTGEVRETEHFTVVEEFSFASDWSHLADSDVRDLLSQFTSSLNDLYGLCINNIIPFENNSKVQVTLVDPKRVTVLPIGAENRANIQVSVTGNTTDNDQSSEVAISAKTGSGQKVQVIVPPPGRAINQTVRKPSGSGTNPIQPVVVQPQPHPASNASATLYSIAVPSRTNGSPLVYKVHMPTDVVLTPAQLAKQAAKKTRTLNRVVFTHDFGKAYFM